MKSGAWDSAVATLSDRVTENHRFRATGGEPFAAVEADTPEAALDKMRRGIVERMAQGGA